jgi:SAM-dependent methyltransferase
VVFDVSELASGLHRNADGIWVGDHDDPVSFSTIGHAGCFALEDASFWFAHRNAVLLGALARYPPPGVIIDVGGGNGFVTQALVQAGHAAILLEPGRDGVYNARLRGVETIIHATLSGAHFRRGALPAVGLFDVLEHVQDDRAWLCSLRSLLAHQGRVYLTVPALSWLWSEADSSAGHHRRYSLQSVVAALQACALVMEYATYFFSFLVLPILAGRTLGSRLRRHPPGLSLQERALREHLPQSRAVLTALAWLGRFECSTIRSGRALPLGSSCLVVATAR